MFESTVHGTEHLVELIRSIGWRGRFVHVSSYSVYALNACPKGAVVSESTPEEPNPGQRDDYSWTKILQERVVRRLDGVEGVDLVVVRPGAIYGPERQFQPRLGRQIGDRVVLLLGGTNAMPLTYVENTVDLIATCGRHPAAAGRIFNAVDQPAIRQWTYLRRWLDSKSTSTLVVPLPVGVLDAFGKAYSALAAARPAEVHPPVLFRPYAIGPTTRSLTYAPSQAHEALAWSPPHSVEEALARTFDGQAGGPINSR
jgi:nucleoside-diphosphate-sugar epimerase